MKDESLGFRFWILEKELARRRKELEHLRVATLKKIEEALAKAAAKIPFTEAYIFGSVTKPGRFREDSDVDIGFYGLRDRDFFRMASFLSMELKREVDIVQLEGHRLGEKVTKEGKRWRKQDSLS